MVIDPGSSGGGAGLIAGVPSVTRISPEVAKEILSFLGR